MYESFDDLFAAAKLRRIEDVFAPLNLKRTSSHELKGPCPNCGAGTDRLVVDTKKQIFFCRHCAPKKEQGAGDVIAAAMFVHGFDNVAAAEWLTGNVNVTRLPPIKVREFVPPPSPPPAGSTAWKELWEGARALYGSIGLAYLTRPKAEGGRALVLPEGFDDKSVLRFHPHCPTPKSGKAGGRFVPAVLALYRDVLSDEPKAIMRIGLTKDGHKIERWDLGGKLGAAIKLMPVTKGKLCIAEGVETALAARMLGHTPVWATGGRAGMAQFPLIDGVNELGLLVDHDVDGASQVDAVKAFEVWTAAGRDAWFDMPPEPGTDFNDMIE
jgi:Toprim domain